MVRFSCFQAHIHSHKNKKTIRQSAESMKKTLEDASRNHALMNFSYSEAKREPCLKEEGDTLIDNGDHVADSSPTERDCRSEEMGSKYNTDSDIEIHKNALIKKSQSLGSGLNWKERTSGTDGSEDEMEHAFSHDGSADCSGIIVRDGINDHGLNPSEQFQEPIPSDSVRGTCNFTKNDSIFLIEDPQQSEKEIALKNDMNLSGSGDCTPRTPPVIVKSSSLPSMSSPHRFSTSLLPCSRSAEDLNALNSRKNGMMHEIGRQVQNEERYDSISNNEKNNGEIPADGTFETYNYVGSSKDWIIPVSDGVNMEKGESSYHSWDEVPAKDFRLKRIQAWVNDLQQSNPLEDSEELAPCDDHQFPKGDTLLEEPTASKLEVRVNPGSVAAKRYISSLNASATAAQMTNLGLVVIPFLSAFVSLKTLNLSGNAIVRITAGALPRGLHGLNLSKNNISTIEGLRDLTRLRVLDLSYNRILRIGHGLAGCSSIKELYLAGNKISEVEGLHRLLKLNVLDLRFNKVSTTKCLGQLAANYNCLQALSLEGNPAQKNVGDEQLKKYVQNLLPRLTYYNRQSIKVGIMKDTPSDRSSRLGINAHQVDRGLRVEVKTIRKGTHGIVAQKVSSSSIHGRKSQGVASSKLSRSRHGHGGRLPPVGIKATTQGHQFAGFGSKVLSLKDDSSIRRSRSEGTLGVL
ncbi:hypothetical protein BUALT_Bualt03G0203000 [Buddleja alternifolia]|uniref:Uncharacterized protein n=1 Tax=Buddleja alternifolia TaxID=168488 RepID=A0AAV6XZQ1_9LAMI|nr:hypothetical protein BUALT_Bualt03G0203000 [Buddleja alternifolia]